MTSQKSQAELKQQLPMFIGLPRSGNKWIQAVMEVYFNRHRFKGSRQAPSFLESAWNTNIMWSSDHDNGLDFKTNKKVIYLYRDPVDVCFSLVQLRFLRANAPAIVKHAKKFKNHYNKWVKKENVDQRGTENVLVIQYEKFLKEQTKYNELRRIVEFLNYEWSHERAEKAFKKVGDKKNLIEKNGPANFKNKASYTDAYAKNREAFRNSWADLIYSHSDFTAEHFIIK